MVGEYVEGDGIDVFCIGPLVFLISFLSAVHEAE